MLHKTEEKKNRRDENFYDQLQSAQSLFVYAIRVPHMESYTLSEFAYDENMKTYRKHRHTFIPTRERQSTTFVRKKKNTKHTEEVEKFRKKIVR